MTTSTPFDLAAAFRSFPRRIREAMAPVAGDAEYAESIHVSALYDDAVKTINEVADIFGVRTAGRSVEDVVSEHSHYDLLPGHLVDKAKATLASTNH